MPARSPYGFTLVEVMISLVITSMIVGALYSALGAVAKSWNTGAKHIALADQRRAGTNFVRREIAQLAPLRLNAGRGDTIIFKGEAHELTFVAPIPSHRAIGGLFLVNLRFRGKGPNNDLTFRYKRLSVDGAAKLDEDDDWDEKVIIDDVQDIAFSYFGAHTAGVDESWGDAWESEQMYPDAIRLTFEFQQDKTPWPDLVVPIRANPGNRTRRLALMLREPTTTDPRGESPNSAGPDPRVRTAPDEDEPE